MIAKPTPRTVLVCNCQRTMTLEGARLGAASGAQAALPVHSELCRSGVGAFEGAVKQGGQVLVACMQEAPLFRELAADAGAITDLSFVDIRDGAGWGEQGAAAGPKMRRCLPARCSRRSRPASGRLSRKAAAS